MLIYFIVLFFVLILSKNVKEISIVSDLNKNVRITNINFVICIILIFSFFSGFRYMVGSDWWAYYAQDHQRFSFALSKSKFEPGWNIIGFISTSIWNRYGVAMLIAALITNVLFIFPCYKISYNFTISILMFFYLVWAGTFNGVRQYLATAILFAGHRFILDKKLLYWGLIVIVAMLFHTTAIIMFPLYFIARLPLDKKQFILLLLFSLFAYSSYDLIFQLIGYYKEKEMILTGTKGTYLTSHINIFRILIYWVPVLFYYFFVYPAQKIKYNPETNFYGNLILISAVLMTAAKDSAYLGRVGIYTQCYLLLAWPLMFKIVKAKNRILTQLSVFFLYSAFWFYDILSHEDLNNFQLWIGK